MRTLGIILASLAALAGANRAGPGPRRHLLRRGKAPKKATVVSDATTGDATRAAPAPERHASRPRPSREGPVPIPKT